MKFSSEIQRSAGWVGLSLSVALNIWLTASLFLRISPAEGAEPRLAQKLVSTTSRLPSLEEVREVRFRKDQLKEAISDHEGRLGFSAVGEKSIKLPYSRAFQVMGWDWLIPLPDGQLSSTIQGLLLVTPDERERIEAESRRIYEKVKQHQTESVIVHSMDTESTVFEIPASQVFIDESRQEFTASMEEIAGVERGEILAQLLLKKNPWLPQKSGGVEVRIERTDGGARFSERFGSGAGEPQAMNRQLGLFNLEQLERRYGHIADLSAWGAFLDNDRSGSGGDESSVSSSPAIDAIPSLLDFEQERGSGLDEVNFRFTD